MTSRVTSLCCSAPLRRGPATPRVRTQRCPRCGSLWSGLKARNDLTWTDLVLPEGFVDVLRERRLRQAAEILAAAEETLHPLDPLLDYGTGQGAFLSAVLASGRAARGCDLDDAPGRLVPDSAIERISSAWA